MTLRIRFFLSAACLAVSLLTAPGSADDSTERSLAAIAREAKANGRKEVVLQPPIVMHAQFTNLDDVLAGVTVVRASLVSKTAKPAESASEGIDTWFKFHIVERLAGPLVPFGPVPTYLPPDIPVGVDDFLLRVSEGQLTIDGVVIKSGTSFEPLAVGNDYVLFASFHGPYFADLPFGSGGIYEIKEDETLRQIRPKNTPLDQALNSRSLLGIHNLRRAGSSTVPSR